MPSFFDNANTIEITAFDKHGNPTSVEKTNSYNVLNRISKALMMAAIAASSTVALADTMVNSDGVRMITAEDGTVRLASPDEKVFKAGTFTPEEWKDIRTTTLQAVRAPKENINFIDITNTSIYGVSPNVGPMAISHIQNKKMICTTTLQGMHSVGALMTAAANRSGTFSSPELTKKIIIHHEIAHCMVNANIITKDTMANIFIRYFNVAKEKNADIGETLQTLTFEREADTSALLTAAREYLGKTNTLSERQEGLKQFNIYAQGLLNMRIAEEEMYATVQKDSTQVIFNNHFTRPIIETLVPFINQMANDDAKWATFKETTLSDKNVDEIAMTIALGSVMAHSETKHPTKFNNELNLEEAVNLLPGRLSVGFSFYERIQHAQNTYRRLQTELAPQFVAHSESLLKGAILSTPDKPLVKYSGAIVSQNGWIHTLGLDPIKDQHVINHSAAKAPEIPPQASIDAPHPGGPSL